MRATRGDTEAIQRDFERRGGRRRRERERVAGRAHLRRRSPRCNPPSHRISIKIRHAGCRVPSPDGLNLGKIVCQASSSSLSHLSIPPPNRLRANGDSLAPLHRTNPQGSQPGSPVSALAHATQCPVRTIGSQSSPSSRHGRPDRSLKLFDRSTKQYKRLFRVLTEQNRTTTTTSSSNISH